MNLLKPFRRTLLGAAALSLSGVAGAYQIHFDQLWSHQGLDNAGAPGIATSNSAAEITAYDSASNRFFTTNAETNQIDAIDGTTGAALFSLDPEGSPTSVAVSNGVVAVAVEGANVTDTGSVQFFDADGNSLGSVATGPLPDMITFSPDGNKVLVANEGEPNSYNQVDSIDPEGSISVIDISGGIVGASTVNIGFSDFNAGGSRAAELPSDVRIFGPSASVAQDLEPEYISVSPDGTKAFVTLQENNAVAVVDLSTNSIERIDALGFKDHSLPGNELDPSDRDSGININNWPLLGMYQPDAISSYDTGGITYYVTANEGDARDYTGFGEEERVKDLTLDSNVFTNPNIQDDDQIGRIDITTTLGDADGNGEYDALYSFGSRSFSIWNDETGSLVFDSGSDFEEITAAAFPDFFNIDNDENVASEADGRSDAKGPEPEAITIGEIEGMILAFIGLERIGGIMIYDITDRTIHFS